MSATRSAYRFRQLAVSAAAALAIVATAPDLAAQGRVQTGQPPAANKPGEYGGVVPGDGQGKVRGGKRKNRMTWLGFQPRSDGAARLFVQLTSEVPYTQELRDGILYIKLEGVRFANRNARRRLDTRFFETALRLVTSRYVSGRRARKGKPARSAGVELRIEFKNPSDARQALAELVAEKDGYHYLFLAFDEPAGGSAAPTDADADVDVDDSSDADEE